MNVPSFHSPPAATFPVQQAGVMETAAGKIIVFGEGVITVQPEQAVISLGAITEAASLQEAQQENAERISSVIQAVSQLNIPERDIQTADFQIDTMYDYIDGQQTFRGYQVMHLLTIRVAQQLNQAGLIVDAAVNNGANTVRSVRFTLKDRSARYLEALQKASLDGFTKARAIASRLHVVLDPAPVKIVEKEKQEPIVPFQTMALEAMSVVETPIRPGTMIEKASLEMTFTYKRRHTR
ncbi:hypothetical protein SAMN05421736_101258 [Evansella caseinilytica]|uniref:Uncharacterized protein n=1 Tax=Evansella caseinilytica TaxID=1503961 RepID=A0A1H3GRY8_9BACI|nr:SIMPL domain-containing protein [Evansella caseinilytica]SDY05820.1 hypothetical protein SAMN05421736_101258 [Evansella caseinilytica]